MQIEDYVRVFNRTYIVDDYSVEGVGFVVKKSIPQSECLFREGVDHGNGDNGNIGGGGSGNSGTQTSLWTPGLRENGSFGPPLLLPENPKYLKTLSIVKNKDNGKYGKNNKNGKYNSKNNKIVKSESRNQGENEENDILLNSVFYRNPCHIFTVLEQQSEVLFSLYQADRRWSTLRFEE